MARSDIKNRVGETYKNTDDSCIVKTISKDTIGFKFNKNEEIKLCVISHYQKFVKVEEPVSFVDVLKSDKKCRVEHEIIEKLMSNEENDFDFDEYMEIDEVLFELTNQCEASETRDVLLNGIWYLES